VLKQDWRIYRATTSPYIVFAVIFGGNLALWVPIALRNPSTQLAFLIVLLLGAWLFTNAWIASFRLEIGPETLTCRCLFGGRTTLNGGDISAARDLYMRSGNALGRGHLIEIRTKAGVPPSRLKINPNVFPREANRDLRHSLQSVWTRPKERSVSLVG